MPGGIGGASNAASAARTQAQTQQRIEAQIQQRTQVQVQQRVAAQAQSRVQVEAARAAVIAQQAAAIGHRQAAAARQNVDGAVRARVGANVNSQNEARVANQSASANAHARLGIQAGLLVPPGITQADVQIYDNIFGRFNPLREQRQSQPDAPQQPQPEAPQTANNIPSEQPATPNEPGRRPSRSNSALVASSDLDLTTRIQVATRQRRAEISGMRDHALATANTQLLLQAEQMEEAMSSFVQAQARARAEAESSIARRPDVDPPRTPPVQAQGRGNAQGQVEGTSAPNSTPRSR